MLRRIAAICDESMIDTIERLAREELARLEQAERERAVQRETPED